MFKIVMLLYFKHHVRQKCHDWNQQHHEKREIIGRESIEGGHIKIFLLIGHVFL